MEVRIIPQKQLLDKTTDSSTRLRQAKAQSLEGTGLIYLDVSETRKRKIVPFNPDANKQRDENLSLRIGILEKILKSPRYETYQLGLLEQLVAAFKPRA
jgi:hypothetical protein